MLITRHIVAKRLNGPTTGTSAPWPRIRSLDIFRGLCVAAMILVNTPGDASNTYAWLSHAAWQGWTFADTIMPAFLWIVGLSTALSTAKRVESGDPPPVLLRHAARRSLLLLGCGLLLEGYPHFDPAHWELTGVLQMIAVAYFVGFIVHLRFGWIGQIAWVVGLLALYLALMLLYPVPHCGAGSWSSECNFARYLDEPILAGHEWLTSNDNDPFGLMSMLSSCATVLLGVLTGRLMASGPISQDGLAVMTVSGALLVCAGLALSTWIPINKTLWTPSFVLLMAGLSSMTFAACHALVEQYASIGRWLRPFEVLGLNAIVAFIASRVLAGPLKVHLFGRSLYADVILPHATSRNASLIFAMLNALLVFVLMLWMYRRRLFIKL